MSPVSAVWRTRILLAAALLLAGCDQPVKTEPAPPGGGGTIEAINHTSWAINRFSVNGQSGLDIIGPYSGGGGGCCFGVSGPWKPGMTVKVDWETGVAFASDVPEIPQPVRPNLEGLNEEEGYKVAQAYSDKKEVWYPISTHEVQFLIELQNIGQGSSSPIEQRISVLDASTGYPLGVLQDKTRQIPCVHYPASALAECQKAEEMAFEQKRAAIQSYIENMNYSD
ncbi:DUF3304 domain-containing protein [Enterobacter bugandensis]|uniref:DUF3304 domain-containing protein n=1 Tax=Enterobacter bugandensis TaxID=881260 RepID=UPI0004860B73|nr:DUF3304 domain-containing protein [Enterobacter bugandensis]MDK7610580.1 DUF3304 domain-containing protein [Enterobacter bugandensis]PLA68764.1 DUF3304 domain-containing protein [Enterobacter bugandensis]PLA87323.1 DUF3304 domain-containing protein [Enterobacter bugandensis]HDR2695004.1 DUF3304 domain-containing protein [Enterobacter bugandensis]HDS3781215.1 DUF3304 domain-containing protein [Enterobacter bugandensis]